MALYDTNHAFRSYTRQIVTQVTILASMSLCCAIMLYGAWLGYQELAYGVQEADTKETVTVFTEVNDIMMDDPQYGPAFEPVYVATPILIEPIEAPEAYEDEDVEEVDLIEAEPIDVLIDDSHEQLSDHPDWSLFKRDGVWDDGEWRYTWYSSRVLYHYRTPEWHTNDYGIYEDEDGYIVVASSDYSHGTVLDTAYFGAVKVYDSGCPHGTLDVYVNW